jgi:hypothetical protein
MLMKYRTNWREELADYSDMVILLHVCIFHTTSRLKITYDIINLFRYIEVVPKKKLNSVAFSPQANYTD